MSEPGLLTNASETLYVETTFRRILRIWWAYFWRHMLYGGVVVVVVRLLEGLAGLSGNHLAVYLSEVLVMATMSVLVLAIVLHKRFRQFSIRLVASPVSGE